MTPRVFVTCGPSYEPVDEVRRLTNHSTGELGSLLAGSLAASGFRVVCFRGEGASYAAPDGVDVRPFTTNASLLDLLEQAAGSADAIFHAAALCDFGVEPAGEGKKIPSRGTPPVLRLFPLPKVLARLRPLFPEAVLIGWKYELDGSRGDVLAAAERQLQENQTDACVVNGSAYGPGFGFLQMGGREHHDIPDKSHLTAFLTDWLAVRLTCTTSAPRPDFP